MKKRIRQGILVILTMLLASSVCFAADSEGTKLPGQRRQYTGTACVY